ncbi:MAG: class I SAM-dependent methyltransferase [Phycisphaerales bacterium]|jgi:SAM-dependent methyltransferase|nr:class I SAM-dependent methyltransferase [Phycisphaerales bacterium]
MSNNRFDDLTDIYEAMIDWPKRLANDEPFFRRLFGENGVRKVLDLACGTGRHAAMFHGWGLEAMGVDISANMLDRARKQFGESDRLKWKLGNFDQPIKPAGSFDAALCLGNSPALAGSIEAVGRLVGNLLAAVRPGGVVMMQAMNIWKLPDGPCVWQKIIRKNVQGTEAMILKGVHRCGDRGFVELLVGPADDPAAFKTDSFQFLGLRPDDLQPAAINGGADEVNFYGNHKFQPYEAQNSPDLIMVARKSPASIK